MRSMNNKKNLILSLILLAPGSAFAIDDKQEQGDVTWNGEVEFGYIKASGNSDVESILLRAKVINDRPKWNHEGRFNGLRNESDGDTTAKAYTLQGNSKYKLSDRDYLFGLLRYERDDFAGYDSRVTGVAGYGQLILKHDDYTLNLEVGAGVRKTAFDEVSDSSEGIGRLAGDFKWKISDTSDFSQEVYIDIGSDNTVTNSLSEVKVKVIGHLAVKMALSIINNTDVPPDTDKTDIKSAVTVVYDF